MSTSQDNPPSATLIYSWNRESTGAGRGPRGPYVVAIYEVNTLPGGLASPSEAIKNPIAGLPQYGDLWEPSGDFAVPCRLIETIEVLGPTKFIAKAQFGYVSLGGGGPARNYRTAVTRRTEMVELPRWQKSATGDNTWIRNPLRVERYFTTQSFTGQINQSEVNAIRTIVDIYTGHLTNINGFWHVFRGADIWTDAQNVTRYVAEFETSSYLKGRLATATLTGSPDLLPLERWKEFLPDGTNPPVVTKELPTEQHEIIPTVALNWIEDL